MRLCVSYEVEAEALPRPLYSNYIRKVAGESDTLVLCEMTTGRHSCIGNVVLHPVLSDRTLPSCTGREIHLVTLTSLSLRVFFSLAVLKKSNCNVPSASAILCAHQPCFQQEAVFFVGPLRAQPTKTHTNRQNTSKFRKHAQNATSYVDYKLSSELHSKGSYLS